MNYLNELREKRGTIRTEQRQMLDKAIAEKRDLSPAEEQRYGKLDADAQGLADFIQRETDRETEDRAIADAAARLGLTSLSSSGVPIRTEPRAHPLALDADTLDAAQGALEARAAGRWTVGEEHRAALVTTTLGAPRAWGSNVLDGPRLLHVAAGVPSQSVDAVLAQHPKFTLPTASAAVAETLSLGEYDTSNSGSVTLARFGRWTDLSRESLIGADAGSIAAMHQVGIAKDLDLVLIDAVETAAGAAVAFSADVPAAVRKAMATVIDATAAADSADLVVLVHPDNAALLQDVTPIGGSTIAEGFQRFSGALVYASSAVNTGFITVANLAAGARYFEARGVTLETDTAVKTDVLTVATSVIGGYGIGLTSGFAVMVDVVTP